MSQNKDCKTCFRIACKKCNWVATKKEVLKIQQRILTSCPRCGWKPGGKAL